MFKMVHYAVCFNKNFRLPSRSAAQLHDTKKSVNFLNNIRAKVTDKFVLELACETLQHSSNVCEKSSEFYNPKNFVT